MALEIHEEFRTKVKRNRNSLMTIKSAAKSPNSRIKNEISLSYNHASPQNKSELKGAHGDRFK